MDLTLQKILSKDIFENYTILSGQNNLDSTITSISVLETPDFNKYISFNSLILTTFYIIKTDYVLFEQLLSVLHENKAAGLIIKMNRYIDVIPDYIIEKAKSYNIPLITLNYDANLSVLFNDILNEIQLVDYTKLNLESNYGKILSSSYETLSTSEVVKTVVELEDLDILIKNLENDKIHYSSQEIFDYYQENVYSNNSIVHAHDKIIYSEIIIYDRVPIYQLLLLTKASKRHIISTNIDIYKLLIVFIYQKKTEAKLRQNQFLLDYVTNLENTYTTNKDFLEISSNLQWDIVFPITLLLFNLGQTITTVLPRHLQEIKTIIARRYNVPLAGVRYVFIKDQLLFIMNTNDILPIYENIKQLYEEIQEIQSYHNMKIAYSNLIYEAKDIPNNYSLLSNALNDIKNKDIRIFKSSNIHVINFLRNIEYSKTQSFIKQIIGDLIIYEQTHNVPLIATYYAFLNNKFNITATSKQLFIHYNTLRYRLGLIEELGFNIHNESSNYLDIHLALYLHVNFASE